jgi:DNA-binding NtrC family response regulator
MIEQFHLEHNREHAHQTPVNMIAEVQQQVSPPQPDDVYKHLLDSNLSLQEYELNLINKAMESTNGNMTKAAELLGITRRQIAYKLK